MTVHPTEERLNDYVDGYLPPAEVREVEHHLALCEGCRVEVASLRDLLCEVAALPPEITPPPDLWVGIREETVELPARRRETLWGMRHGLAAAAVVLVALSSTLTLLVTRERTPAALPTASLPAATVQPARPAASPAAVPAALAAFREAETEYVRTVADLEAVFRARREQLSPQTIRVVEENLRIIDTAIREARAALEADPGSAELPLLLSSIYRGKIDVLERAVRLSSQT
jgi:anti-sigma factor RsiW